MKEDVADRPALSDHQCSEAYDRAVAVVSQGTKRFEYPLIPKGSLTEQYDEGRLQVACVLDWPTLASERGLSSHLKTSAPLFGALDGYGLDAAQISHEKLSASFQDHTQFGRKKQLVLVRDVQVVKVVQGKFSAGKGLHFTPDVVNSGGTRSVWGLSRDGAFRAWPVFAERELDVPIPLPAVVLDHDPVRVIQADAEIVNNVADDQRGAIWKGQPEAGLPELPRIWVEFTSHGFDVRLDVTSKSLFKLADVMIGPFYFEKRTPHSEIVHA